VCRGYTVISDLEALVAEHPYREPLWAQLMTAYYVADRQSDALEAYLRLRSVLADDLGIDPGPTITALHARILRQERLDTAESAKTTAASALNRPGMSGDSTSWEGWSHVRWFVEEVSAGAA